MIPKGVNASSVAKSIERSHGVDVLNERSCKTSFNRFKSCPRSLKNKTNYSYSKGFNSNVLGVVTLNPITKVR